MFVMPCFSKSLVVCSRKRLSSSGSLPGSVVYVRISKTRVLAAASLGADRAQRLETRITPTTVPEKTTRAWYGCMRLAFVQVDRTGNGIADHGALESRARSRWRGMRMQRRLAPGRRFAH